MTRNTTETTTESGDDHPSRTEQLLEDGIKMSGEQQRLMVASMIMAAGHGAALAAQTDSFPEFYSANRDEVVSLLNQLDNVGIFPEQKRYTKFRRAFDDAVEEEFEVVEE